jgi:hypothetical protein
MQMIHMHDIWQLSLNYRVLRLIYIKSKLRLNINAVEIGND